MKTLNQIIKKGRALYGKKINADSIVDEVLIQGKGWTNFRGTLKEVLECCDIFTAVHFEGIGDLNFSVAVFSWHFEDHGPEGVFVFAFLHVDNVEVPFDSEGDVFGNRMSALAHTPADCVFFEDGAGGRDYAQAVLQNYNEWQRG